MIAHGGGIPPSKPACDSCGFRHVVGDVYAVGRFADVSGFRTPDGEVHATRELAQEWLCQQRRCESLYVGPGARDE